MRTFVAIDLDPEIKKGIILLIEKLDRFRANIKWIKPQGMHLTLKFTGEIPENKADDIQAALKDISLWHEGFHMKIVGTGRFPEGSRFPRVLWVGIENSSELIAMQKDLESRLEKLSIPREKRMFHPHLTLGRVKSAQNIAPVLKELSDHTNTRFGSMDVKKITFFRSILKPTGAEYSVLSEIKLK
jgi:2'-5' RNA ligase